MSSKRLSIGLILGLSLALSACGPKGAAKGPDGAAASADAKAEIAKATAFLNKNAKAPGVVTLPSGLQYKVISSGPASGLKAKLGDDVKVQYEGTLVDGTVFDSSYESGQPAVFTVGQVVPAWNEALQLMRPGDVWYLYVPSKLGYGDQGSGPIPGGAVMIFKIEVLGVLPAGGGGSSANG